MDNTPRRYFRVTWIDGKSRAIEASNATEARLRAAIFSTKHRRIKHVKECAETPEAALAHSAPYISYKTPAKPNNSTVATASFHGAKLMTMKITLRMVTEDDAYRALEEIKELAEKGDPQKSMEGVSSIVVQNERELAIVRNVNLDYPVSPISASYALGMVSGRMLGWLHGRNYVIEQWNDGIETLKVDGLYT